MEMEMERRWLAADPALLAGISAGYGFVRALWYALESAPELSRSTLLAHAGEAAMDVSMRAVEPVAGHAAGRRAAAAMQRAWSCISADGAGSLEDLLEAFRQTYLEAWRA
jgi:hypothetical protein